MPVTGDLLSALGAIHAAGWRHGDLKPENILAWRPAGAQRWEVRILDFGLAEELGTARAARRAGTPAYIAPEVLRGAHADHRADLYAVGVILCECLGGLPEERAGERLLGACRGKVLEQARSARLPQPLGRLIERLLEPDPAHRLPSAEAGLDLLGLEAPGTLPSFEAPRPVGRKEYFELLREGLSAIRSSRPRPGIIAVEGSAGLGRTRLLREALTEAFGRGIRGVTWDQALAGPAGKALPPVEWEIPQEDRQRAAIDARSEAVFRTVTERPTLLVVDDFERLGRLEVQVLRSFAEKLLGPGQRMERRAEHPPLVLLAGSKRRGPQLERSWQEIVELPWTARVELEPWSQEECREYLDQVLRPQRDLGGLEEALLREGAGVPARLRLFLRELARARKLRLENGSWRCCGAAALGCAAFPGEKERFLAEWRRVGGAARDVAGLCAVASELGGRVSAGALRSALSLDTGALDRAARELEATEFFRGLPEDRGRGSSSSQASWRARRLWLLRDAGPTERSRWRRLLSSAEVCEEAVIYQRVQVGSPLLTDVLSMAGRGGPLGERTLARHARDPRFPPPDRARSALALARLLLARGQIGRAEGLLKEAPSQGTGPGRALVSCLLGQAALARRAPEEATAWFERAGAEADLPAELQTRLLLGRAFAALLHGQTGEASRLAAEGLREHPGLACFWNLQGNVALAARDDRAAEEAFAAAIRSARSPDQELEAAAARTNYGRLLARTGRLREAARLHQQAAEGFERAGCRAQALRAIANLGTVLRRLGDFDGSVACAGRSLSIARELGDHASAGVAEANLGILARELGLLLLGTARRKFSVALAFARSASDSARREMEANLLLLENRALLAQGLGRLDEAQARSGTGNERSVRPDAHGPASPQTAPRGCLGIDHRPQGGYPAQASSSRVGRGVHPVTAVDFNADPGAAPSEAGKGRENSDGLDKISGQGTA